MPSNLNLYHIQDADRPMYVFAPDWNGALAAWRTQITTENPGDYDTEPPNPEGIAFIADNADVIVVVADPPAEDITLDMNIGDGDPDAKGRKRCDDCRRYFPAGMICTCTECTSQLCTECCPPSRVAHPHSDMGVQA